MLRILHLDDSDPDRELICRAMVAQGIEVQVHCAKSGEDFARIPADVPVDLVLCDSGGPRFQGREALALVRQLQPEAVFLFVTGQCKEAIAESLAASGADGIVRKDNLAEMAEVLPLAFERQGRALWPGTPGPSNEIKAAGLPTQCSHRKFQHRQRQEDECQHYRVEDREHGHNPSPRAVRRKVNFPGFAFDTFGRLMQVRAVTRSGLACRSSLAAASVELRSPGRSSLHTRPLPRWPGVFCVSDACDECCKAEKPAP